MKKKLLPLLIVSIILIVLPVCNGSFEVQPRELYLSMDKQFIKGNTSETIKVINAEETEINISWYLDNPSPDLIRQNRTTIPDLSWVDLEPKWQILPGNSNDEFFIHVNIPDEKSYLDQHWEIWITFKEEESGFIKFEHAVRFYIDTPKNLNEFENNALTFSVLIFIFIIFIVLLFIILFYKKKKKS